ncbi:MAG: hypothetical protein ABIV10_02470 [Gemmatimonadaceae bacterium]
MTARVFEDATGARWEVFEVRRSSQKALAVSAGLEHGWLAFGSGTVKRRLAPIPDNWQTVDDVELERLCGRARVVGARAGKEEDAPRAAVADADPSTDRLPAVGGSREARATPDSSSRTRVPRIRSAREHAPRPSGGTLAILTTATSDDSVESTVREYARQARELDLPAIEAMVQLKGLLMRVYTDANSEARDLRAVRRWFVEAFYFERGVPDPDTSDQSR